MSTQVLDKKTKDQIILENLPLVKKVASKIYYRLPKGEIDFDELVNTGIIGLMKAIDRYDKDKAKFSTYAYIKIRGEILDYLRSLDVMPRSMREKIKEENLEEGKNLPLSKTAIMVSIEKAIVNGDEEFRIVDTLVSDRISPEEEVIKDDIKEKLLQAIETLNEKEQIALQMLYFEEKSLQEVADVLKVSVSRVSQIKSEAVKKLRNVFKY